MIRFKYILIITLCLLSFIDTMAGKTHKRKNKNSSVSIGLITRLDTLRGMQLNLITSASSMAQGVQLSGISNISGGLKGVQIATFSNISLSPVSGLQFSPLANISRGIRSGTQISALEEPLVTITTQLQFDSPIQIRTGASGSKDQHH